MIPERRSQFPSLPVTIQSLSRVAQSGYAFSAMTALRPWECNLTGDGEPERLGGARVSANFFSLLGVPIARGRGFSDEEEQPGKEKVVVISDGLWRRRYGSDPGFDRREHAREWGEPCGGGDRSSRFACTPAGPQLHSLLPFAPRIDVWKPIAPHQQRTAQRELGPRTAGPAQTGRKPRAARGSSCRPA